MLKVCLGQAMLIVLSALLTKSITHLFFLLQQCRVHRNKHSYHWYRNDSNRYGTLVANLCAALLAIFLIHILNPVSDRQKHCCNTQYRTLYVTNCNSFNACHKLASGTNLYQEACGARSVRFVTNDSYAWCGIHCCICTSVSNPNAQ